MRLLGIVNSVLRTTKEGFREESEGMLKQEREAFKKTTESGDWLKDREQQLKALAQARYLARRSDIMAVILRWMGDCLLQACGQGNGVAFVSEADTTLRVGRLLGEDDLLRRVACLDELVARVQEFNRPARPHRPMPQQPAHHPAHYWLPLHRE